MAFEAVLKMEINPPVNFTVADGTAIPLGTVCKLSDPFTAAASSAAADTFAGIAFQDKISSNGQTKLGLYRDGIFLMYISGSASAGDPVCTDAVGNYVKSARALSQFTLSGTRILGHMLEDATTGQQKLVWVQPQSQTI